MGHFPGNPIIPGALLLSEALRAIEADLRRNLHPLTIRSAKFVQPVRPGERVLIEFFGHPDNGMKFRCTVAGTAVLAGELICDAASARD
jgi:3-hydroxyacyl-[acyl-carrier-protein] dehydratase